MFLRKYSEREINRILRESKIVEESWEKKSSNSWSFTGRLNEKALLINLSLCLSKKIRRLDLSD